MFVNGYPSPRGVGHEGIEYIVFEEDEVVVGSRSEPGLVPVDWITSLLAGLPELIGEGLLKGAAIIAGDVFIDTLIDILTDTDTSEVTPIPMGTPSDAGVEGPDGGVGGDGGDGGGGGGSGRPPLPEDMDPDPDSP